jgi:hypothetical protein
MRNRPVDGPNRAQPRKVMTCREELLDSDKREPIANCSVTRYEAGPDGTLQLADVNAAGHRNRAEEPVTEEPVTEELDASRA